METKRSPIIVGGIIFFSLVGIVILVQVITDYIGNPTQANEESLLNVLYLIMFFSVCFLMDKITMKIPVYQRFIKKLHEYSKGIVYRPIWLPPLLGIFALAYWFDSPLWVLGLIFAITSTISTQIFSAH